MKACVAMMLLFIAGCTPSGTAPTAANTDTPCRQSDVTLNTWVGAFEPSLGRELTIRVAYPDDSSCESPEVTAELENAQGARLSGVRGSPVVVTTSGTCSTNAGPKCSEETYLYWSNWCGTEPGPYQIAALAFGGRLKSAALIGTPPPCADPAAPSKLGGVDF